MYDSDDMFGLSVVVFLFGAIFGLAIGTSVGKSEIRAEAVKAGAAHYEAGNDGTAILKWGAN